MENSNNAFLAIKVLIAAVCGAFTAAFGWLGWLIVAWVACMALDWLSGSALAPAKGSGQARWPGQASGISWG